jgi:outer membrane protein assembly factor BamB
MTMQLKILNPLSDNPRHVPAITFWVMPLLLLTFFLAGCAGDFRSTSGWSAAALYDNKVFIGTKEANLTVLDSNTGRYLWSFPKEGDEINLEGIYGTPIVHDGVVYFGAYNGILYAIDLNSEREIWTFQTDGHIVGSPAIETSNSNEHHIVISSSDGHIYAVDRNLGRLVWEFEAGGGIWSTPVIVEGVVYFGALDGTVYAVSTTNTNQVGQGELIWSHKTSGAIASTALVFPRSINDSKGGLFIGSFDKMFYALDLEGNLLWQEPFKASNWFWNTAIYHANVIYVGSMDGNLYAIDALTGKSVWSSPFTTGGPIVSSPTIVESGIAVGSDDGNVYLVDSSTGREIRSFTTKDKVRADLTAENSNIYFSDTDHNIRSADLKDGFWIELWCYNTKKLSNNCD